MLFNKITNTTFINTYNIIIEILIGFGVFAIFFGIFMNYYFTNYEVELLGTFIKQSISFYKGGGDLEKQELTNLIKNTDSIKELNTDVKNDEHEVHNYNKPYDDRLMIIILGMIAILLCILLFPLLLGFIRLDQLNFKYIGLSTILHIILIIGFELFFLLYIITFINPVKLYNVFETNKSNTGKYI